MASELGKKSHHPFRMAKRPDGPGDNLANCAYHDQELSVEVMSYGTSADHKNNNYSKHVRYDHRNN
jgi:hypothetical protein